VHETVERTGLAPGDLVLHVSGTLLAQESELAPSLLTRLREIGVRVALDDFGGGCCSLDQLQQLPLDLVRIDFAVVDAGGRGDALLPPLVDLAHVLDLTVLVDGVVTARQHDVAAAAGADLAQGSLFARAMSVPAMDLMLDGRASDADGRVLLPLGG
jgi:EAL domain-containing protein (putative c-di-GMP-specific phosphodiesterase class I)